MGSLWILMGLTGSLNVFRWDIDECLNPELRVAEAGVKSQSLDRILEVLRAAYPERQGMWSLELPRHEAGMVMARHFAGGGSGGSGILFVSVHPGTAQVVASRRYSDFDFLVTWIYDLHSTFFLGDAGSTLAGCAGLLLTTALVSGAYLWWPRSGAFRGAFSLRIRRGSKRLVFDLHKLLGVYGFVFLFTASCSGAGLVFFDSLEMLVARFSPVEGGFNPQPGPPQGLRSLPFPGRGPISAEQAMAVARSAFPDATVRFVKTPDGADGIYGIQMRQPGEASQFFTTTSVWLDQYTGEVLATRDPRSFTGSETFLNLLWPIHNGEIFGFWGRVTVCITGILPLGLALTGVMRWLQKRRARSAKSTNRDTP